MTNPNTALKKPVRNDLIRILREKSFRVGDFTLASGKKSKFYLDVKRTSLDSEGAYVIGCLLVEKIESLLKADPTLRVEGVGGLTLGADPLGTAASLIAYQNGYQWPAFIVRKEPKGYGLGKWVEGRENMREGARVIVLEDVTTTGGSSLKAVERLREEGFDPALVLTVVDRQEGAEEFLREKGVKLASLVTLADLNSAT